MKNFSHLLLRLSPPAVQQTSTPQLLIFSKDLLTFAWFDFFDEKVHFTLLAFTYAPPSPPSCCTANLNSLTAYLSDQLRF